MESRVPSALVLPQVLGPSREPGSGRAGPSLLRSAAAARALASVLRPCYGPHGRQKLLVVDGGEAVCTGQAAAILKALRLEHPAARLIREAAQTQAERCGDGTAFVVLLTAALLEQAEGLLRAGLTRSQAREALAAAAAAAAAALPALAVRSLGPLEDPTWALLSVVSTHLLPNAGCLARLVAQACWASKEPDGSFRAERVGVCALRGGTPEQSCVLPGLALPAACCGMRTSVPAGARLALFACPFGPAAPGLPAVARLSGPADLAALRAGSERALERQLAPLAALGINVAVASGDADEAAVAVADRLGIMVLRAASRRDLAYLSEVLDTPLLPRLEPPPRPGRCRRVYLQALGGALAAVLEEPAGGAPALTLVLRGATAEGLRGARLAAYRAIDAFAQLCRDPRLLPGAGAAEMALAAALGDQGRRLDGPRGPAFLALARALRSLPGTLAANAGLAVAQALAELSGVHQAGNFLVGVGAEGLIDVAREGVWDPLVAKLQALQTAADTVMELVTVDEIVLAREDAAQP
ncbi:T-complex protein 1 subunit theta-like 2 [Perognathus longimembris pacificus]|uniref:T-complex protein 1 subunit theta-like 2 n=1 Tax=Perognathus longimembris pacificus TaxID=214514 RepID=UPI0020194DEC|nr:T-complex protein 1 subunit theta-like 2 [Perognathus longimembris pacificus]